MNKKVLFLILICIIFPLKSKAYCEEEDIIRISKMANNITTLVEYNESNNTFNITFTNLTWDFMIEDTKNNNYYSNDFELTIPNLKSGNYKFNVIDVNGCFSGEITSKNISLPYYNMYYKNDECTNFSEYEYCSKWLKKEITYDEWEKEVSNYKKNEENTPIIDEEKENTFMDEIKKFFVSLYVEHYYIFLPIIIISLCAIIYLKDRKDEIVHFGNKKERLKL